jgi:hypothetical protein
LRVIAAVLLMCLPCAFMGLAADDFDLAAQVRRDPFGAYRFQALDPVQRTAALLADRARGDLPWWIDEHFHQAFLRPLASLSLAADFRFWPHAHWWMHVENVLLFAGAVGLAFAFYRGLFADDRRAALAALLYATNPGLALSVAWLSARNTLLATLFGFLSLYLDQRSDRSSAKALLRVSSLLAFGCALLSAEIGLSTLGFLVAARLMHSGAPAWLRCARLLPFMAVAVVWRLLYGQLGFGVIGSAYYRDPSSDLAGVLLNLLAAIPIYLGSVLTQPFAAMTVVSNQALLVAAFLGCAALALVGPTLLPLLRRDARARFLALAALLAIPPLATTLPQDRLTGFVGLGSAGVVALLLTPVITEGTDERRLKLLYRIHAVWRPLLFVPSLFIPYGMAAGGGAMVLDRDLPRDASQTIVLLNAPCALLVHHFGRLRVARGLPPPRLLLLSSGISPVSVRRLDDRQLELEVPRGFLRLIADQVARDVRNNPFRAGDVIDLNDARVTILAVAAGDPTRVRFELFDAGALGRIYAWQGREVRPFRLPAPGDVAQLPALSLL